jgi:hypothetical protein
MFSESGNPGIISNFYLTKNRNYFITTFAITQKESEVLIENQNLLSE